MSQRPRFLVYKRTHRGDPDARGIFGVNDCMKSVREKNFTAVIGVGGVRPWKDSEGKDIAKKVTWVGYGPTRHQAQWENDVVTFSEFYLYDENGPLLADVAPILAKRMFGTGKKKHVRVLLNLTQDEHAEALAVLELARSKWRHLELTAKGASSRKRATRCAPPKRVRRCT